jgi:hypothetical protein
MQLADTFSRGGKILQGSWALEMQWMRLLRLSFLSSQHHNEELKRYALATVIVLL